MVKSIAVYCASSQRVHPAFFELAAATGRLIASHGFRLVYGGGDVGLMDALARSVHDNGGTVVGVIPKALEEIEGIAYAVADELVITKTMSERKQIMYSRSDAYLALPGGFGTLEEFLEVLTLRKLRYHHKPVVLLNYEGFYDGLLSFFSELDGHRFVTEPWPFEVASTPDEAIELLAAHLA